MEEYNIQCGDPTLSQSVNSINIINKFKMFARLGGLYAAKKSKNIMDPTIERNLIIKLSQ